MINKKVDVLIEEKEDKGIQIFKKDKGKISDYTCLKTKLILSLTIKVKLFDEIKSYSNETKIEVLKYLLSKNDSDIIYFKPFIGNNTIQ